MLIPLQTVLQGRYQIIRIIAQGGIGAVYEAFDTRLQGRVAIKQLMYSGAAGLQMFEREAHMMNSLRHPGLARVSDYFSEATNQFLVMDYIEGNDLSEMLAQRGIAFDVPTVLDWMHQLLTIIMYLHNHQPAVLHRDIKPNNIKIAANNHLMLLDFGLSKGHSATQNFSLIGYTPHYAPLEQIQGTGTDARSDIYAIGATIYHLLTNHRPSDALTRAASIIRSQPDPLIPPIQLNPAIPSDLNMMIMHMLAQNPIQRPATATHVYHLFINVGIGIGTQPYIGLTIPLPMQVKTQTKATSVPLSPPISRRTTFVRWILMIFLIAGTVGSVIVLNGLPWNKTHESVSLIDLIFIENNPINGHNLSNSPDGNFIAFGERQDLYVYEIKTQKLIDLGFIGAYAQDIEWNFNSEYIALTHNGNCYISIYSLKNQERWQEPRKLCATDIDWGPDNNTLIGIHDESFWIWDMDTDNFTSITLDLAATAIDWSNNKDNIAMGLMNGTVNIWNFSLKMVAHSFETQASSVDYNAITGIEWDPQGQLLAAININETRIWDISNKEVLYILDTAAGNRYNEVFWNPDGSMILTNAGGTQKIWDVYSGVLLYKFPTKYPQPFAYWMPNSDIIIQEYDKATEIFSIKKK